MISRNKRFNIIILIEQIINVCTFYKKKRKRIPLNNAYFAIDRLELYQLLDPKENF